MSDPLSGVDIAQLRTFHTVYRLASFSEAASELGVNQSTVSYAISRLRSAFGDPLFVRQGATVRPTERCHAIAAAVPEILANLEALAKPAAFDPSAAQTGVTISCNTYERLVLIPPALRRLRREATGLRVNLITAFTQGSRRRLVMDRNG